MKELLKHEREGEDVQTQLNENHTNHPSTSPNSPYSNPVRVVILSDSYIRVMIVHCTIYIGACIYGLHISCGGAVISQDSCVSPAMSANDILDVLNVQRDDQPAKKKARHEQPAAAQAPLQKGAMARELYNLLGPNTPPVNLITKSSGQMLKKHQRVSPWTRMSFVPNRLKGNLPVLYHWEKGSKALLDSGDKDYYFDRFNVSVDIPDMVDEATYDTIMNEIREQKEQEVQDKRKRREERRKAQEEAKQETEAGRKMIKGDAEDGDVDNGDVYSGDVDKVDADKGDVDRRVGDKRGSDKPGDHVDNVDSTDEISGVTDAEAVSEKPDAKSEAEKTEDGESTASGPKIGKRQDGNNTKQLQDGSSQKGQNSEAVQGDSGSFDKSDSDAFEKAGDKNKLENEAEEEWSYEETKLLFQFCKDFELKWHVIHDRYPAGPGRTLEDLKEQFYRVCGKIFKYKGTGNPNLLDSLDAFSKLAEVDRKQYLESLLKRTPAEIAEEESLVIEARRFELAAKKMLLERSQLLALLDSPQSTQSVQQYQSSQGLTNLYNNLMILDKHQKRKLLQKASQTNTDPVPPPIPQVASSSHKRDRGFQTHLQQYLSGVLKQQNGDRKKSEPNAIQQLLSKRLTSKEEEAYGLHYHANERLTPSVILRSSQKLLGLQQRQSVFKAVNSMLQDLDIPTAGGTVWRPNMPTRKTMAKYDEMIKSVVALLDVKKARDKLEAEIELVKSLRKMA